MRSRLFEDISPMSLALTTSAVVLFFLAKNYRDEPEQRSAIKVNVDESETTSIADDEQTVTVEVPIQPAHQHHRIDSKEAAYLALASDWREKQRTIIR